MVSGNLFGIFITLYIMNVGAIYIALLMFRCLLYLSFKTRYKMLLL